MFVSPKIRRGSLIWTFVALFEMFFFLEVCYPKLKFGQYSEGSSIRIQDKVPNFRLCENEKGSSWNWNKVLYSVGSTVRNLIKGHYSKGSMIRKINKVYIPKVP